jgi:hypothetical protein
MNVAALMSRSKTMFSKHWKRVTLLIMVMLGVGTFIIKAPGVTAKTKAAFSGAQHLLHDADTDGREVRPVPLLG